MHMSKLTMPETPAFAKMFHSKLLNFRVSYSAVGNTTFGPRIL